MKHAQSGIRTLTPRSTLYQHNMLATLRHAHFSRCNGISAPCIASSYVVTATPARYIKSFPHKLPVSFNEHQGCIKLAFGLTASVYGQHKPAHHRPEP